MKTHKWIAILVLVLAQSIPAIPVSAAPSASIAITPLLPNPAAIGNEVSFALVITATDIIPGVSGADIYLGYDNIVEPPTSPIGVVEPLPDFFGPSNITWYEFLNPCPVPTRERTSPACIHLVSAGPAQETHSGAVARFHFLVKAEGRFCFEVLRSTLADKDGFRVNHSLDPEIQCNKPDPPVTVIVKGIALRQGTPTDPNPGGGSLACSEVKIVPAIVAPVFTVDPKVEDYNFKFELTNPASGAYTIHAEYPGYLASEKTITISGGLTTIDAGTTTLCGGDVNADSAINILDIGTIIGNFGKTNMPVRSDPQYGCADADEPTDINDDSLVNIFDLAIAAGNWGPKNNKGPTDWRTDLCDP